MSAEKTPISTEWTTLEVADGTRMQAYVARPASGAEPRAGLLVLQEIFGVNAHIRDVTERLAREGYVALAPDLFHRTAPRFEGRYDDVEGGRAQAAKMTPEGVLADLGAAWTRLDRDPGVASDRIGAIGFCMGGRLAFRANAGLPLRAAVSFYGGGIAGMLDLAPQLHAPMLFFWGGLDAHIPVEQRHAVTAALREYGKSFVDVEFSQAEHGFFCDARASYEPAAAAQAWALTRAFLSEHLRGRRR